MRYEIIDYASDCIKKKYEKVILFNERVYYLQIEIWVCNWFVKFTELVTLPPYVHATQH